MIPSAVRPIAAALAFAGAANAQWDAGWLAAPLWSDGKAEFNVYDARIVRYGQPRPCEVLHILVREPWDPVQGVKRDDHTLPGTRHVLKLIQVLHVPTGVYVYGQSHSAFWDTADGQLVKWSVASHDSCGNSFKIATRDGRSWDYAFHTYWDGMARGQRTVNPPPDAVFYDELPALVRRIDFARAPIEFTLPLAPTAIQSKSDALAFAPATFSAKASGDGWTVEVRHAGGTDTFRLDREFPRLLRSWEMADGSSLTLRKSLRLDYWNHSAPGDRERVLGR
jgi:hypothetical protein